MTSDGSPQDATASAPSLRILTNEPAEPACQSSKIEELVCARLPRDLRPLPRLVRPVQSAMGTLSDPELFGRDRQLARDIRALERAQAKIARTRAHYTSQPSTSSVPGAPEQNLGPHTAEGAMTEQLELLRAEARRRRANARKEAISQFVLREQAPAKEDEEPG